MKEKITYYLGYDEKFDEPTVVCLGFFDCLHLGHLQLISRAELIANIRKARLGVFTFFNNPFSFLSKSTAQVLNFEERAYRLTKLGVDVIFHAQFDEQFAQTSPIKFLENLIFNKNITDIVVGDDYCFGANAKGNVQLLREFCDTHGINLCIENLKKDGLGVKYSSSNIRKLVRDGLVEEIHRDLAYPYFIMGEVVHGRKVGNVLGFPTANIAIDITKERLKEGVYLTNVIVDGVSLRAITNVGMKPTFSDYTYNAESHILFLNEDLYGKKIIVEFIKRIRDTIKFSCVEDLKSQIANDLKFAKEYNL